VPEGHSRRLAAVLAADIAGYSALMGSDEVRTVRDLKEHQAVILRMIGDLGGRVVDTAGDGILAEFPSIVNAVECGVAIQREMAIRNAVVEPERRMEFRIGINFGDVIYDATRIFGDGINVAARLEGISEPGGICISGKCHEEITGRVNVAWDDLGEQRLKNIARPVRVYRMRSDKTATQAAPVLTIPDRPSIAVLPFQNMSGDPEQEYFADGVVEEIITGLARLRWLFVIARNSSFTYKGRAVDVKQVGRELGVRYLLEGSVRKAPNRVRITGQLIDTSSGAHLWADHFDGSLEDIFDLQDQVTGRVVGAIAPKLEQAEIERAKRKPTESLDAYDYFLRGVASLHQGTRESNDDALGLFANAIKFDPTFASAHGIASFCYVWRKANGWMTDRKREAAEAAQLAFRAAELGKDDAVALAWAGFTLARVAGDFDAGLALIDRALLLNPNLAAAWQFSGRVRVYRGEPEVAIEHLARALRLNPLDPFNYGALGSMAYANFFLGRYEEATVWAEKAMRENPNFLPVLTIVAASNAFAGRPDEAKRAMERVQKLDPALRVSNLNDQFPLRRSEDNNKFVDGLRNAGLPE
jgi:TolB-like protein/tetratricopeptide (TPR) repeat protein